VAWTIVASIGDRQTDLEGGNAERGFLVPYQLDHVP
jgi:hypothetical protein